MSWFNGQILKPTELAAAAGLDFRTTYGFGQEVKLWLENGEHYNSIPATVAGVSVGAQGSVQYKLALAIGDTGLFTTVEIPAGWVTSKDVLIFDGPPDQVDATELKQYMGQSKPGLNLVVTNAGRELATRLAATPTVGVEIKGIHVKREGFAIFDKNNKALGDAVHQAMVATVQRWIERYQSFEYGDIRVARMGDKEIEVKFRETKAVFTHIEANSFNLVIFNKGGARLHTYSYSMEELGVMIHMLVDNFCPPN